MINKSLLQKLQNYIEQHHTDKSCVITNRSNDLKKQNQIAKHDQNVVEVCEQRCFGTSKTSKNKDKFKFAGKAIIQGVAGTRFTSLRKKDERKLTDLIENVGESFTQMLCRMIDERGLNYIDVYKKANIDRRLFSKIRSCKNYRPKKDTVIQLALAMELSLDETIDLLARAEYSFSKSSKRDIIITFCIENGIHDILQVDEYLYEFNQRTIIPQD